MHVFFADDPDLESTMVDSIIVRAHARAAGARKTEQNKEDQAVGRLRGGFSTKIHVLVDALRNPLDFTLTGGQVADVTQADGLLSGVNAEHAILDKPMTQTGC